MIQFIKFQVRQIQQGGALILARKSKLLFNLLKRELEFTLLPIYVLAIPAVLIIRLIKPWLLVRLGDLRCISIGHFAANTELYFCERDAGINVPNRRHIDIFYMRYRPICNQQLATMLKRVLRIWPSWILGPIYQINRLIPGGKSHVIVQNTQHDRDVHNLLDRFPPHLQFTAEEETRGEAGLLSIGIPIGAPFVCLIVRDSAYLTAQHPSSNFSYHNYRDNDIQNFVLAAEELAERGYFVIRMGAKVHATINSIHPKVIDYATNGMRTDYMDVYLCAKCAFIISTGTGLDAMAAWIFRRPAIFANIVPLAYLPTYSNKYILTTKRYCFQNDRQELSLSEIFTQGVGFCMDSSDYESKGVDLIENTPEEIRDVAIEMAERLAGTWQAHPEDDALQQRFWEIFPTDAVDAFAGNPLHGEIRARIGTAFLSYNPEWLQ
jgi:putative glycosyltransferase (TIGR04372 family)